MQREQPQWQRRAARLEAAYRAGVRRFNGNLTRLRLRELTLPGLDLEGHDLGGLSAEACHLEGSNLSDTTLNDARFTQSHLTGADLSWSTGEAMTFDNCRMHSVSLFKSKLVGLRLLNVCLATGLNLGEAVVDGGVLDHCDLTASRWGDAILRGTVTFRGSSLIGADFRGVVAEGTHFHQVSAHNADFRKAFLARTIWEGANLRGANFGGAYLEGSYFAGADLTNANFAGADLSLVDFSDANLTGACLDNTVLIGADVSAAVLRRADLTRIERAFKSYLDKMDEKAFIIVWIELLNGRIEGSFEVVMRVAKRPLDFAAEAAMRRVPRSAFGQDVKKAPIVKSVLRPRGLAERWVSGIRFGNRRENSALVEITYRWMIEWLVDKYGAEVVDDGHIPGLRPEDVEHVVYNMDARHK